METSLDRAAPVSGRLAVPLLYLLGLTAAESLTALVSASIGLALHGLLLAALILHAGMASEGPQHRFLLTLALAPLIRLLSLSLPLDRFVFVYWYVIVGAPLFVAAFLAARAAGLGGAQIGLTWGRAGALQLLVGLSGVGLGYLEYLILRPAPLVESPTWAQVWLPAVFLVVFTGFLEELVFRGLMQRAATESFGRGGVLYVAVLFAVLHLGYLSALDVAFVFGVGLAFGMVVARTGSIWGVTLSHGLTNIALFLIFPSVY